MRLTKLMISNYRCFDEMEIDLDEKLTVLVAPNGSGKTTVLDALRVALWPFVKGFDLGSQTGKGANIQISDVRLSRRPGGNMEPEVPSFIEATGKWYEHDAVRTWTQRRERIKPGTNTLGDTATRDLGNYARTMETMAREDSLIVPLPLISYLGTSRLWFEGRFTSTAEEVSLSTSDYSRTSGYLNCLALTSSFKTFTIWYSWIYRSYREEQIKAIEQRRPMSDIGEMFKTLTLIIKDAVNHLVKDSTGWSDIEYSSSQNQNLVMTHPDFGTLPVDRLSDGLRNAIAMVADLAFRAAKLNPQLGRDCLRLTPGVVLIDEVDMFLHPTWQQTILSSLQRVFENVQFIVSTHSPQVLTTVGQHNIRLLGRNADGQWQARQPEQEVKGVESAMALNETMKVNPVPPVEEAAWFAEYNDKIEAGTHEDASGQELRKKLLKLYGSTHPLMLAVDRLVRFQAFKLKAKAPRLGGRA